ncbi:MAG: hypothetical protein DRJ03_20720 [Chloroflexi bacterium]|nr:MAG: hypothetical protein B6I35_05670 [Anaerolineaceae bacterium 4572_32.2]RLC78665.1 MAG: hypothetical protein DRI81_06270 [Chloroflexota bacterium]RLC80992.1 MAG: hypothetical protein DRJ03_20720 [Chloroflexota bacterium]HEY73552.1 hypothetical protein [Thermoflexia bacterium]
MAGKKLALTLLITIITLNLWPSAPTAQAQDNAPVQALILLVNDNPAQLTEVVDLLEAQNGQTRHVFPNRAVIALATPDTIQSLAALPSAAAVFTQAIEPSSIDSYGPNGNHIASVWNNLIASQTAPLNVGLMASGHPNDPNDALTAPDLPSVSGRMLLGASAASVTPGYYQTSEYMAGSVAVGVVLVESDGSTDPSTEDWTSAEKQQVFDEIVTGLNWWAEMEPRAHISFVYDDHFSNPLPTSVEPISRPYSDQKYWIADAMSEMGYDASFYFTQVRDYNNDLRAAYQTDWAFTIFVVDSSADGDNRFSDNYFAYAYLGGPFTVMTYGNNGYGSHNMDAVIAHETGHIFHALDQYYSAHQPCTRSAGYLGVENQNSLYGDCTSNENSIMRGGISPYGAKAIDSYAAGQVGWRDSDGDDILDPLDTDLPINITSVSVVNDSVTVTGATEIIPYPSPSRASVTINTLARVQYRFNEGDWQQATADDGAFDGTSESYHFTASLPPGLYTLEVVAVDSAGNVSEANATETISILDPIDGGLNTELHQLSGAASTGNPVNINGMAYHLQGGIITSVEYRINGGDWQLASAQDGAFDSDYEPFTLSTDSLAAGTYVIEARAADGEGNTEVNFPSYGFTVAEEHFIFLPLVVRGL